MLTFFRSEFVGRVKHSAHLLVGDDLVGGRENEGSPTLHKSVGFRTYFPHLAFQLPLGRQKTVPQIISD